MAVGASASAFTGTANSHVGSANWQSPAPPSGARLHRQLAFPATANWRVPPGRLQADRVADGRALEGDDAVVTRDGRAQVGDGLVGARVRALDLADDGVARADGGGELPRALEEDGARAGQV